MSFRIFKIEEHGIDAIPREERSKTWWDLFVIQAGVNITLPSFLIGGLLVPGLSWSSAVAAIVLGNLLLGALLALMGHFGVDHGIPTSVASRFSLGYPKGTWLSSLCILLSLVGWFAVTAELAGLAVDGITREIFGWTSPALMIGLIGISNSIPAIIGFENIKWLSRVSVPGLLGLSVWLFWVIVSRYGFTALVHYRPTNQITFTGALDIVIGGLIVGVFVASDLSRYIRSRAANWAGSLMGVLPASALLGVIGLLCKLATGDWNAVNAVQSLGLGVPALLIIVFATWTTNDANLYSAGLALTNVLHGLARWQNTLLLSFLGTFLAVLRISDYFEGFLLLLTYAFSPLVGIFLCDYFLVRKGRLNLLEAYQKRGRFFYFRGVNLAALLAVVLGFLVGVYTPAKFMASLAAVFFSAAIYLLAMKWFYAEHFSTS